MASDRCKIIAAVTIEGLAYLGKSEVPHVYLCSMSGVYLPPSAPLVCGSAAAAYMAGRFLQTPSAKKLLEKGVEHECQVVVRMIGPAFDVMLVKGAELETKADAFVGEAQQTYRALNEVEGIHWLMRVLAR
jgi:hypothetical protein